MMWWECLFFTLIATSVVTAKPNFVILFADDLGYGDLSSFGHPTIYTPNLDRMLFEGKKLTQWYSAWCVCTPSRAALLTGRIPLRSGMGTVLASDSIGGIPANETLLSELLKSGGYTTGIIGKWHLGQQPQFLPTQHGFDYYYGVPYSADMGAQFGVPCPPNSTYCQTYLPLLENETIVEQPVSLEGLELKYAAKAVSFLHANQDKPFFLYMAHNHAHVAVQGQWCSAQFNNTSARGIYGSAVQEMDYVAGQILDTLRALKLDRNTLVVFTSDNGPWLIEKQNGGSAGLFYQGKGTTWEGGIRMPAIAWWPGTIPPMTYSNELVSTMDLFTTFLSLADIPIPSDRIIDGLNVTDVLLKNGPSPHEYLFFWNGKLDTYFLCAVRKGNYKIHFFALNLNEFNASNITALIPPLLFDVNIDPSEKYPLNTTVLQEVVLNLEVAAAVHVKEMTAAVDQANLGTNTSLAICCNPLNNCICGQPSSLLYKSSEAFGVTTLQSYKPR